MASEKSFQDRLQRSNELKLAVAAMAPAYTPADAKFSLLTFETTLTGADAAHTAVEAVRPGYQDKTGDRAALVKALGPLVTHALAYVKSNGTWANRYDALKKQADKVRGISPRKPPGEPEPAAKTRENGEQSYAEITAHYKAFIDRLEALSGYAPPDARISVGELHHQLGRLLVLNSDIPGLSRTLVDHITDRQTAFAELKTVFDGLKTSVKGQYGQQSVQYQAVSGYSW